MDERLLPFKGRLEREVLCHPAITANSYTRWFGRGEFGTAEARELLVQFSVLSNQFLVAQLHKVLNAETHGQMRASKEFLANEIGVGYRRTPGLPAEKASRDTDHAAALGSPEGSIGGGTF